MIHLLWSFLLAGQLASPEALQHLHAGEEAEKNKNFDVAIAEFRKLTALEPTAAEGYVRLGQAYLEKLDYGAAIEPLTHALTLSPELLPAHQLLGYALLAQGSAAEAIPHLRNGSDKAALGIAQLETGELKEALANLQEALNKRPNDPDLLYYFGRASGLLSKQAIDTVIAAYPDSARAHQAMAENYYVLRQMPQAEKEFQEAIRLRPDLPKLHLELGLVYASSAQWPKAEEAFRAETKVQPGNAEAAYRLGDALLVEGKSREARAALERADRLQPGMPETLYSLGKASALEGDSAAAEKAWKKVIEIEKESPLAAQAHFALGGLYRKLGQSAAADREIGVFNNLQNGSATTPK